MEIVQIIIYFHLLLLSDSLISFVASKACIQRKIETEVSALFNTHMKGLILFTLKSVEISVLDGSRNNCLNSAYSISLVFFMVCTWGMETDLSNHENIVIIEKILVL